MDYEKGKAEYIRLICAGEPEAAEKLWAERLEPQAQARYEAMVARYPRRRIPPREPVPNPHRCPANPSDQYQALTIQEVRVRGFGPEADQVERLTFQGPPMYYGGVRIKDAVVEASRIRSVLGCCRYAEIASGLAALSDRRAAA